MKRLWTDFNETYDDDYVWTSTRNSPGILEPLDAGEWVILFDDDHEECWAIIDAVNGPIVHCKIDWSTWNRVVFESDPLPAALVPSGFNTSGGIEEAA